MQINVEGIEPACRAVAARRGAIDRASGAAGAGAFAAPVATCVSAGGGPSSRSYKHLVLVHGRLILFKFRTIKATVVYQ